MKACMRVLTLAAVTVLTAGCVSPVVYERQVTDVSQKGTTVTVTYRQRVGLVGIGWPLFKDPEYLIPLYAGSTTEVVSAPMQPAAATVVAQPVQRSGGPMVVSGTHTVLVDGQLTWLLVNQSHDGTSTPAWVQIWKVPPAERPEWVDRLWKEDAAQRKAAKEQANQERAKEAERVLREKMAKEKTDNTEAGSPK